MVKLGVGTYFFAVFLIPHHAPPALEFLLIPSDSINRMEEEPWLNISAQNAVQKLVLEKKKYYW